MQIDINIKYCEFMMYMLINMIGYRRHATYEFTTITREICEENYENTKTKIVYKYVT